MKSSFVDSTKRLHDHLNGVYQRLFDLYESVVDYVKIFECGGEPSKEEKHAVVIKANEEFWHYFLHNRPYVPSKVYQADTRSGRHACNNRPRFCSWSRSRETRKASEIGRTKIIGMKAFKETQEKATPMFSALVAEIQCRLGVVDPE